MFSEDVIEEEEMVEVKELKKELQSTLKNLKQKDKEFNSTMKTAK